MRFGWWLALMICVPRVAGAVMPVDELGAVLERLQAGGLWGEAVLLEGWLRSIQVDSLGSDSVAVREVIGPLYERRAVYAKTDFRSVRELGARRIPREERSLAGPKSLGRALVLELAIPGAGYFYVGEVRQGLTLLGMSAAIAGTGLLSGRQGAAGWVPFASWIKVASLLHLRDEVRAMNQLGSPTGRGRGSGGPFLPPGQY